MKDMLKISFIRRYSLLSKIFPGLEFLDFLCDPRAEFLISVFSLKECA